MRLEEVSYLLEVVIFHLLLYQHLLIHLMCLNSSYMDKLYILYPQSLLSFQRLLLLRHRHCIHWHQLLLFQHILYHLVGSNAFLYFHLDILWNQEVLQYYSWILHLLQYYQLDSCNGCCQLFRCNITHLFHNQCNHLCKLLDMVQTMIFP